MQDKVKEVIANWESFSKAKNDDGEFVIIAEKDNGGSYEEYKECLGVLKDGSLIWSYLSGCSCYGGNDNEKITDITAKIFKIDGDKNAQEFYDSNKCEPSETSYCSY